jgi:hypothetical protein
VAPPPRKTSCVSSGTFQNRTVLSRAPTVSSVSAGVERAWREYAEVLEAAGAGRRGFDELDKEEGRRISDSEEIGGRVGKEGRQSNARI